MNCSKCGRKILPEPLLGDRQGGPRRLVHMATTQELNLCSICVAPLFDLYEAFAERVLMEGTVKGHERLKYLPRADGDQ